MAAISVETRRRQTPDQRGLTRPAIEFSIQNGHNGVVAQEVRPLEGVELVDLHDRALQFLLGVTSPDGHMVASEDFRFHHEFARDLMESAHSIHEARQLGPVTEFGKQLIPLLWQRTKQAVLNFWDNQLDSGQLPHEVKPYNRQDAKDRFFHRLKRKLVTDDSVDATPLGLIVTPLFIETREEFEAFLPRALRGLDWITHNMDTEGYNGWLCYKYNDHNGGHINQGWMDAKDSITYGTRPSRDDRPIVPIALVEVQGYAWKALRLWADILRTINPAKSEKLLARAHDLKRRFNEKFVMEDERGVYLAHALDGNEDQVRSVSINPGLALWASYEGESIVDARHIPSVVARLMSEEMFDDEAGIRTFENGQETYVDHEFYQTGDDQFWPIATVMSAEGMDDHGFREEAKRAMRAGMFPLKKVYRSFVEHFIKNGTFLPLFEKSQNSRDQTWTAASALFATTFLLDVDAFHPPARVAA